MVELRGIGASHGIAVGRALVIGEWELDVPHYNIEPGHVRSELRRFLGARRRARTEIAALRNETQVRLGERYAAIFDAHLLILDDRHLGRETMLRIREQQMNAEWALAAAVNRFHASIETVDDPYIRERGGDLADVHERLQRILAGEQNRHERSLDLDSPTVVVAHALSPSDAAWLHQPQIVGFVTEEGSKTSHTAILASALEIPAVLSVEHATHVTRNGQTVIVDGSRGRVIVQPSAGMLASIEQERERRVEIDRLRDGEKGPIVTADGVALCVSANIEFPDEMQTVHRVGAEGVGLYRTEFLFLSTAPQLPGENDHIDAYQKVARDAKGQTVVIRTLDLGGEKYFHRVLASGEANPVLGLRAVRYCLARPEIFRTQLRGLLRVAHEHHNVWIMVPMISGVAEWRRVRSFVDDVRAELRGEGVDVATPVPLGCMIEVPSAALIADRLAEEADFFSIGTNDLIQYLIAVDRGNRSVAYLSDPWHPAVLRMIREVIRAADARPIPVSLCGELASDPLGALTLLGLGLRRFSCNPLLVSRIRQLLRRASAARAAGSVESSMCCSTGAEIRERLEQEFRPLLDGVEARDKN